MQVPQSAAPATVGPWLEFRLITEGTLCALARPASWRFHPLKRIPKKAAAPGFLMDRTKGPNRQRRSHANLSIASRTKCYSAPACFCVYLSLAERPARSCSAIRRIEAGFETGLINELLCLYEVGGQSGNLRTFFALRRRRSVRPRGNALVVG
jgi:hypothetical protein